jgi:hypothetical protein
MKRSFAILVVVMCCVPSAAPAEEVGHTKFELPSAQWAPLTTFDTAPMFSDNRTGKSRPVSNKVFYLADADGTIKALLRIAGENSRAAMVRTWRSNCPEPKAGYFTIGFGSNRDGWISECLIVSTRFSPSRYFKPDSAIGKAVAEKQLKPFESGYFLRSMYGSNGGAHLTVELVVRTDFKGLTDVRPSSEQTYEVPVQLVAWGESLQKAVKSSVESFRGGLTLPPIEFKQ